MKKVYGLLIGVIVLLQAANPQAPSPAKNTDKQLHLFIETMGGGSIGISPGILYGQAGLSFRWNRNLLKFTIEAGEELNLFSSGYYSVSQVSFCYGRTLRSGAWDFGVSAGAGIFTQTFNQAQGSGLFDEAPVSYIRSGKSALGVPLEAEALFAPRRWGIGFKLGFNCNKMESMGYGGLMLRLRLD